VGAAALAWLLLGETPAAFRVAGALVVLAGVFLAARASGEPGRPGASGAPASPH
jgi:drug/metabolite transporter (DMT)-like permease